MNLLIIGAAGGVGRLLVERALAAGHRVTAGVRAPDKFPLHHERLTILRCDACVPDQVEQAVKGQDAVIATLGVRTRGPITLYSTAARAILDAMAAQGVRRLVFLSNFGILDEKAGDLHGRLLLWLLRRVTGPTLVDHRRAHDLICAEAPEWAVVRPMVLTDRAATGRYRLVAEGLPARGWSISRGDVAQALLQLATDPHLASHSPGLAT